MHTFCTLTCPLIRYEERTCPNLHNWNLNRVKVEKIAILGKKVTKIYSFSNKNDKQRVAGNFLFIICLNITSSMVGRKNFQILAQLDFAAGQR